MRKSAQKHKPEKHEKYPKIGKWQLGVCLALIQVGGCADGRLSPPAALGAARLGRRDKHTPEAAQYNQKARKQSDDGRGVAAEPLGVRPAHTVVLIFVFIPSFMTCPSPPYLPLSLSFRYAKRRLFLTNFRVAKNLRDTRYAPRLHCFPHIRLM